MMKHTPRCLNDINKHASGLLYHHGLYRPPTTTTATTAQPPLDRLIDRRRRVLHVPGDILLDNHLPAAAAPNTARILMDDIHLIAQLQRASAAPPMVTRASIPQLRSKIAFGRRRLAVVVGVVI